MKKIWWVMIASVLTVLVLPLAIDWLIIGNQFPSNISNSDWVDFLGGYIGAIIGSIVSLIGIVWTIQFTQKENKLDRELGVRPLFDIQFSDGYDTAKAKEWLGYGFIHVSNNEKNMPNYSGGGILTVKNVGTGPAVNIQVSVTVEEENDVRKFDRGFSYSAEDYAVTTNTIIAGGEASLGIQITNTYPNVAPGDLSFYGELCVDNNRFPIPDSFRFSVCISCQDILLNTFEQKLIFEAGYYCTEPTLETGASFRCEIQPEEKGNMKMIRR